MLSRQLFYISSIISATGCAADRLPELAAVSEPPPEWRIVLKKDGKCPDATGTYESIPSVASLQEDGNWQFSKGSWYDLFLLIPVNRVSSEQSNPNEKPVGFSEPSAQIESMSDGRILRVTNPDKDGEKLSTYVFRSEEKDFECRDGSLVFPEFQIQGGAEGVSLNGRIYRKANITSGGDLLFYEQVQSYKSVHRYYLFKKKVDDGSRR